MKILILLFIIVAICSTQKAASRKSSPVTLILERKGFDNIKVKIPEIKESETEEIALQIRSILQPDEKGVLTNRSWQTIELPQQKRGQPNVISLFSLKPDQKYELRVVKEDAGGSYQETQVPNLTIKTLCSPADMKDVYMKSTSNSISVTLKPKGSTLGECKFNSYSVHADKTTVRLDDNFKAEVTGLEPGTQYVVNISSPAVSTIFFISTTQDHTVSPIEEDNILGYVIPISILIGLFIGISISLLLIYLKKWCWMKSDEVVIEMNKITNCNENVCYLDNNDTPQLMYDDEGNVGPSQQELNREHEELH